MNISNLNRLINPERGVKTTEMVYAERELNDLIFKLKELMSENNKLRKSNVSVMSSKTHHCGNELTDKEIEYDLCLNCREYLED